MTEPEANRQPVEAAKEQDTTPKKRPYVAPAISSPIDVFRATTFFQVVESGVTNDSARRRP